MLMNLVKVLWREEKQSKSNQKDSIKCCNRKASHIYYRQIEKHSLF